VNQLEFSKSVLGRLTLDICTIYIDGDVYGLYIGCKSTYWADLVNITDLQYHICVDLADAYLRDNRSASFTNAVYHHCRELL